MQADDLGGREADVHKTVHGLRAKGAHEYEEVRGLHAQLHGLQAQVHELHGQVHDHEEWHPA